MAISINCGPPVNSSEFLVQIRRACGGGRFPAVFSGDA